MNNNNKSKDKNEFRDTVLPVNKKIIKIES